MASESASNLSADGDLATIILGLVFGAIVGISLGLTGGGGSIFAVPLFVCGMGVAPGEAVGISLAAVGATSLFGAVRRLPSSRR